MCWFLTFFRFLKTINSFSCCVYRHLSQPFTVLCRLQYDAILACFVGGLRTQRASVCARLVCSNGHATSLYKCMSGFRGACFAIIRLRGGLFGWLTASDEVRCVVTALMVILSIKLYDGAFLSRFVESAGCGSRSTCVTYQFVNQHDSVVCREVKSYFRCSCWYNRIPHS